MDILAEKLTGYIVRQGTVKQEDYALYKYGLQTGMEFLLCCVTSGLIAHFVDMFIEFAIFMIVFAPLRAYVGGIHMKHFHSCFICSVVTIVIGLFFAKNCFWCEDVTVPIIGMLLYLLYKLSYYTSRKDDKETVTYYSSQLKKVLFGIGGVTLFFYCLHWRKMLALVLYILAVVLISIMLEIIRKITFYNIK